MTIGIIMILATILLLACKNNSREPKADLATLKHELDSLQEQRYGINYYSYYYDSLRDASPEPRFKDSSNAYIVISQRLDQKIVNVERAIADLKTSANK